LESHVNCGGKLLGQNLVRYVNFELCMTTRTASLKFEPSNKQQHKTLAGWRAIVHLVNLKPDHLGAPLRLRLDFHVPVLFVKKTPVQSYLNDGYNICAVKVALTSIGSSLQKSPEAKEYLGKAQPSHHISEKQT
jgi:hypothetical protein